MRDLHWSYEGADGPENWGKLDPEFSVCSNGKRQSPIDIHDSIKVDQEPIQFDYKPTFFRIVDNGHTIQINYGAGSHITIMGRTYDLIQFHFHHPAEERIDGKGFAMVAHFVHRDPEGRLAIVAVLLEAGKPNSAIQTLWNNLPLEKNEDYTPRVAIQAADLLPPKPDYISYMGSLTTPPCTEGVLWLVMKQPVQLSPEQIDIFTRFYPNNARPVQAASGRIIKESR
jgi:carbonic anhydrase